MIKLTRRSLVRGSVAAVAATTLARPYIANAAAKTATAWWVQGFAEQEDIAFKKLVADYEKASGNTIDYTIVPYAPIRQKIVSAVTSGVVPDLFQNTPAEIIALYAYQDKLVDVSDVVETQRKEFTETALLTARCYNDAEKKRSFYGVPYTVGSGMNHICRRPIKMSPVCQIQMTLPSGISGGVWGDGSADERWRAAASRSAAGFGSGAIDDRSGRTAARARTAASISLVKGLSDRRSGRPDLETARSPQQPAQTRGVAARGSDDHPPVVLGLWPDFGG